MMDHYILKDKLPIKCDLLIWARWFEQNNRRVASDDVNGIQVSTVFLGIDHRWGQGRPLLFETMVFGGEYNQACERYSTWEEAEIGHSEMLAKVILSEDWIPEEIVLS